MLFFFPVFSVQFRLFVSGEVFPSPSPEVYKQERFVLSRIFALSHPLLLFDIDGLCSELMVPLPFP